MSKPGKQQRALQRRRMQAGRLLLCGTPQVEVARRLGVTRTTVSAWNRQLIAGGLDALRCRPRGRPSNLDEQQRLGLMRLLEKGALAQGFATDLWTLRRVGQMIEAKFSLHYSDTQVWRILVSLGFGRYRSRAEARRRDPAPHARPLTRVKETSEDKAESSSSSTSRS